MHVENEKLLLNVHQQQSVMDEYIQTKNELEKRLFDNEQQLINLKQDIEEKNIQYQRLQNEYQLYKEDTQTKKSNKSFFENNFLLSFNRCTSSNH